MGQMFIMGEFIMGRGLLWEHAVNNFQSPLGGQGLTWGGQSLKWVLSGCPRGPLPSDQNLILALLGPGGLPLGGV